MAHAKELQNFIGFLEKRGLISKSTSEFDYEQVVWDYLLPSRNAGAWIKPSNTSDSNSISSVSNSELEGS